jgi:CDP-glycerol glycerophosphotransferase (TagB/SpsB family)
LRKDQVLVTGYAKEDWLFHPIEREKFYALGIPEADQYIFWLPTFRLTDEKLKQLNEYSLESDTGLPVVDTFEKLQELQNILQEMNVVLVVKLHPFQKAETVHCEGFSNICLLENGKLADCDIQINQLLGYADALISDYSSAAVDYLMLDRPIAFTLDDVEEYHNSRGFVFDDIKQWLPGKEIYAWENFAQFVKDIGSGLDVECEKRRRIKKVMHRFSDDMNCQRILDALGICK